MTELQLAAALSDEEVIERVKNGETGLYELIMRRYNQRLYRVTRAILGDAAESEDVMQEAYVRAYVHLDQFAGRAKFATWLTKIAVYEALSRRRNRGRIEELDAAPEGVAQMTLADQSEDPERQAIENQLCRRLEQAVDALPAPFRQVFVMREIEQMSTAEVASALGISIVAVKIRLHRARAALRRALGPDFGDSAVRAYAFHARRCDRVVAAVFARLAL